MAGEEVDDPSGSRILGAVLGSPSKSNNVRLPRNTGGFVLDSRLPSKDRKWVTLSSEEGKTSIWYNQETKEVSFSKPEVETDIDTLAVTLESPDGEDTLMDAARRIAEGVRRSFPC